MNYSLNVSIQFIEKQNEKVTLEPTAYSFPALCQEFCKKSELIPLGDIHFGYKIDIISRVPPKSLNIHKNSARCHIDVKKNIP